MRRIRHTDAPGRYNHSAFDGVSTTGDEHTVADDLAAHLVAEGPFEDTDEVVLDDADYDVIDDADDADDGDENLSELTKEELYDRATEADIDGRSTMSKAELIDALRED